MGQDQEEERGGRQAQKRPHTSHEQQHAWYYTETTSVTFIRQTQQADRHGSFTFHPPGKGCGRPLARESLCTLTYRWWEERGGGCGGWEQQLAFSWQIICCVCFIFWIERAGRVVGLSSQRATRPSGDHLSAGRTAGGRGWTRSSLSGAGCRDLDHSCGLSPGSRASPLVSPAGKTTVVQEVTSRRLGHVTAAAAEKHVTRRGRGRAEIIKLN